MTENLATLTWTAATLAFVHTALGPDHYLPFIVMSRARKWSMMKTTWVTVLSGFGHVAGSVLLGALGVGIGIALSKLEILEGFRGDLAAWLLIIFGAGYTIWGIRSAILNKPHKHVHKHADGTLHLHEHTHEEEHAHVHRKNLTPWILFTIFLFGPCEPLIPLLMYPAAQSSTWGVAQVSIVFGVVTIATMLTLVLVASFGLKFIQLGKLERYTHPVAGAVVMLSGIAIVFLGL